MRFTGHSTPFASISAVIWVNTDVCVINKRAVINPKQKLFIWDFPMEIEAKGLAS